MTDEGGAVLSTADPGQIRKTHPGLYFIISIFALTDLALGLCFSFFSPTFPVYGMPYQLWGTIYLALGITQLVFLNLFRRLNLVRVTMAASIAFALFFGVGTLTPVFQGKASPQLIILYVAIAVVELRLLIDPFINPLTRRDL